MAASTKSFHVRSTSFPSNSHPSLAGVQECLNLVKAWEACPSRKAQSAAGIGRLKDLYTSISAFLQLPLTQQALCGKECMVRELMDDFLCLMDACGMVKESLQHIREQHQSLHSILRRSDSGLETAISAYQCSRKRMKKDMVKCQRLLTSVEKHVSSSKDNNDMVDHVFIEVRAVTVATISLLSSILSGSKTTQSIFSRLLSSKNRGASEIEKADVAIFRLYGRSSNRETELQLEDVIRCMIQAKVSLLNIVTEC
ncbi:uncharacterized protein LOC126410379 [Nymphaea colorata]|uniref:uncharacterized protein LOC126410379 n=1 Tax=Nymphaea colorata TaxID=210225 RepID=UPI00214E1BB2|nr:uncharacterized protein LOC126410379 [Nymphaea colorata]